MALVILVIFLLGSFLREFDRRREADARRDAAVQALVETRQGILDKLTQVFEQTVAAEEAARKAGEVPATTVAAVVESLRGYVDPALIERAVEAAKASVQSQQGPQGPAGPAGRSAESPTTTSTASSTTTSSATTTTTRQATTTTTRPTTTTTRPCTIRVLGIGVLCG